MNAGEAFAGIHGGWIMSIRKIALSLTLLIGTSYAAYAADRIEGRTGEPSLTAPGDPFLLIYVSGVRDSASDPNGGTATTFHCSNISGSAESVRVLVWRHTGFIAGIGDSILPHKVTATFSTHETAGFFDDVVISPDTSINQGMAAVYATNKNIFCSAMVVDASSLAPAGIALHMVRKNPSGVSQE